MFKKRKNLNLAKKDLVLVPEFQSFSNEIKHKLLNIREHFWQDNMGRFKERAGLFYIASKLKKPKIIVEIGS